MRVLSVSGSPRKGNSEAIILKFREILERFGAENEVILLREKNIGRCDGCVEFCNHKLRCNKKDDMGEILKKIEKSDGYIFVTPNYFKMPPGIFKDFIDRCSIFYTASREKEVFGSKKSIVICVGSGVTKEIDVCLDNVAKNFCEAIGLKVVAKKSYQTKSELKGNSNDIFENGMNPTIEKDLESMAKLLVE